MRKRLFALAISDRSIALIDQGLLAVARFAAMLVFGRIFAPDIFGTLALSVTLSYITVGLNRALAVLPFVFECHTEEMMRDHASSWLTATLAVAGAIVVTLVSSGLLIHNDPDWGWIGNAFLWSAILCPLANIYEFVRRWIIQKRDAATSIMQVLVFNTLTFTMLGLTYALHSEALAIASLAVPYALGALASLRSLKDEIHLKPRAAMEAWRRQSDRCKWGFAEFLADMSVGYGLVGIVSGFLGPIGSAVYAATRNVVAPIYAITSALSTVEPPRFARSFSAAGLVGLKKAFRSAMILHVVLVGFTALVAFEFGDIALNLAYKSKFSAHSTELMFWIVAACLAALAKPFEAWLLALGRPRTLFYCKAIGAVVATIASLALVKSFGLPGVLGAMIAGLSINLGLLLWQRILTQISITRG